MLCYIYLLRIFYIVWHILSTRQHCIIAYFCQFNVSCLKNNTSGTSTSQTVWLPLCTCKVTTSTFTNVLFYDDTISSKWWKNNGSLIGTNNTFEHLSDLQLSCILVIEQTWKKSFKLHTRCIQAIRFNDSSKATISGTIFIGTLLRLSEASIPLMIPALFPSVNQVPSRAR